MALEKAKVKAIIHDLCEKMGVQHNSAQENWSQSHREMIQLLKDLRNGKLEIVEVKQ